MRTLGIVLAATLAATARADDRVPATAMHTVADPAAVCAELRSGWEVDPSKSTCASVVARALPGVGAVTIWRAETHGEQRWALTILSKRELWMSPVLIVPGFACGAGHCHDVTTVARLLTIHPQKHAAAALELQIAESWYLNESQRTYRGGTGTSFVVCGDSAGAWTCAMYDGRNDASCVATLADTGVIARTCRWTEQVDLAPSP